MHCTLMWHEQSHCPLGDTWGNVDQGCSKVLNLRWSRSDTWVRDKERLRTLNALWQTGMLFNHAPEHLRNINYDILFYQIIVKCTFNPDFQVAHVVLRLRFCKKPQTNRKKQVIKQFCQEKWLSVIILITENNIFIVAAFNVQLHVQVMSSWWFDAGM